jgi:hypothetical protein
MRVHCLPPDASSQAIDFDIFRWRFDRFHGGSMNHPEREVDAGRSRSPRRWLLAAAAALLAIPTVALLWVGSYATIEPTLAGFPFFIWYQFLWVFLCAACTWAAFRIVLIARPRRRLSTRAGRDRA